MNPQGAEHGPDSSERTPGHIAKNMLGARGGSRGWNPSQLYDSITGALDDLTTNRNKPRYVRANQYARDFDDDFDALDHRFTQKSLHRGDIDQFMNFRRRLAGVKEITTGLITAVKALSWAVVFVNACLFIPFLIVVTYQYTGGGSGATYNLWTKITWYMGDFAYISQSFRAGILFPCLYLALLVLSIVNATAMNKGANCCGKKHDDPPMTFFNPLDGATMATAGAVYLWQMWMQVGITDIVAIVCGMVAWVGLVFNSENTIHGAHSADKHGEANVASARLTFNQLKKEHGLGDDADEAAIEKQIQKQLVKTKGDIDVSFEAGGRGYWKSEEYRDDYKKLTSLHDQLNSLDHVKQYYGPDIRAKEAAELAEGKVPELANRHVTGYTWASWAVSALCLIALLVMTFITEGHTWASLTHVQSANPIIFFFCFGGYYLVWVPAVVYWQTTKRPFSYYTKQIVALSCLMVIELAVGIPLFFGMNPQESVDP
jgi:hypothetical protein